MSILNLKLKAARFLSSIVVCLFAVTGVSDHLENLRGTVIVAAHSKQRLILAVDSRMTTGSGFKDGICKIIVLDHKTVFTGSGSAAHADARNVYWNAYRDAVQAFDNSKADTNTTRLMNATMAWEERFVAAVNRALVSDPVGSRAQIDENAVFNAMFMGFTEGKAEQYQVDVTFDPATQKAQQKLVTFKQETDLLFGAGGRNETVIEVLSGNTAFAKSERARWEQDRYKFSENDDPIYWAIRLVKLSMVRGPHKNEIGGPVDALEITVDGIRWVQCEPSCQCANTPYKLPPKD